MARALYRPLTPGGDMQARWIDGRPMADVASEFIRPNDRLQPAERLQIYNRMYWYRLLESMGDDCPGLRALLGERRFHGLARAYLARFPSRSFTLRNLCSRLPDFIRDEPRLTAPRTALAREVARFEWAQTVAFDGEVRPALRPAQVAGTRRPALQPYLSLLALDYPVDAFVIAVKRRNAFRSAASNAAGEAGPERAPRAAHPPRRERVHLAVHRFKGRLYYKRLAPSAFRILSALGEGADVERAIAAGGRGVTPARARSWFETWMKLGWLCAPRP
jgi:hypothetical protein